MGSIVSVFGRQILDSRGNPTVEVEIVLDSGATGRAAVPSGASTGALDAGELSAGDKPAYLGKSGHKAVDNVRGEIRDALLGVDPEDQRALDQLLIRLDGTPNKARLRADAALRPPPAPPAA